MDEGLMGIMSIIGPLLLLAVLVWVIARNRRRPDEPDITEKATHDLYDEEEERHRKGLDGQ